MGAAGACGRQRRHARNPASSASRGPAKNTTLVRRRRREGHEGRQYPYVDRTPYTNWPSVRASFATTARQAFSPAREVAASAAKGGARSVFMGYDDAPTRLTPLPDSCGQSAKVRM